MKCVFNEKLTEFVQAIIITLFRPARMLLLLLQNLRNTTAAMIL